MNTKRRRTIFISIFVTLALLIAAVLWLLNQQLFNWGTAKQPVLGTALPTFSPSPIATNTQIAEEPQTPTSSPTAKPITILPNPDTVAWVLFADGFERPVGIFHAGDGSGRIFIMEQAGVIWTLDASGARADTPFLDIRDRVGSVGNEQGLLGFAFHPEYASNGYFFVHYSDLVGNTVVTRYRVSADPNIADPSSEIRFFTLSQPYANHNGGQLAFGPDGYLYLGLGDGGLADDPVGNGQSLTTYLGKILRFSVHTGEDAPVASIPADNPYADTDFPFIWASGLRNPWRFSFDTLTGDLYIGDVGQNHYEEINFLPVSAPGGANFGWDYFEGFHGFEGTPPTNVPFVQPIAEYKHGQGCSITGGFVYRGENLPDWQGIYLYGDYCTGTIWGLLRLPDGSWQNDLLFKSGFNIASFGTDEANEIYLADLNGGIYILVEK